MYVSESGPPDADPVLLLHGGGVAGWMWDDLRARLETTHRVVVPDLPGHGRSADEPYVSHTRTLELLRRDVEPIAARRPLSIVGFSLGAQLAIRAASEWPGLVRRVAAVSAQAKPLPFSALTLRALKLTAPLARQRWFAQLQAATRVVRRAHHRLVGRGAGAAVDLRARIRAHRMVVKSAPATMM